MSERPGAGPAPGGSLSPVVRGGLTDRVIEQLRLRIADGTWPLHHRLPVEAALATELGVGRSTVREAVRVLVHSGLLEVRQGDGTFVRSLREIDAALRRRVASANLLEAFEVRRALEIEVARLAARNRSDAEVVRLRELVRHRDDVYATSGAGYQKAENAVREHLLAMTRNALLGDVYRGLVDPLHTIIDSTWGDAELTRDDPGRPETPDLVRAIEDRDPAAAAEAAERRMDNAIRVVRVLLQTVVVDR